MKNVVGIDIKFPEPINSDFIINNDQDGLDFNLLAEDILKTIENKIGSI